jgi:hypothetical protein
MCACSQTGEKSMDMDKLKKLAIPAGLVFAAYKFGPASIKGAAVAIGAIMVAKQLPYVKDVL